MKFHHTGCTKEWKMQWNWLKFYLIQSIFLDTLYGENTLYIYVFGTTGSPKAHLWGEAFKEPLIHFLGHPVWWKYTLYNYIYVFGTKGFPKAQPHKEIFFLESNCNAECHKSKFFAHFMVFSIFLYTLYSKKRLWISLSIYLGQKAP